MMHGRALPRRTFLSVSAAAGIAAFTGGSADVSARLDIGLIGCGQRGMELLNDLTRRVDVRVAGACDIHRPRLEAATALCRTNPLPAWKDILARDDLDAVVIATPDHWHAPMALAAMQARKDVYCEPPMALNAEDAKAFRDCAHATGRIVQIGAAEPFEGQWRTARDLIQKGHLGRIVRCHASKTHRPMPRMASDEGLFDAGNIDWSAFLGPAPKRPFLAERFLNWRHHWDYSAGTAANDLFGTLAAFLLATSLECPSRASAAGGIYAHDGREVPDSLMMTATYSDGASVVLTTSPIQKSPQPPVIRGERASLFCEGDGLRLFAEGKSDAAGSPIPVTPSADPMTNWLDCLRTRRQPVCNVDLAYKTTLAMSMALEAYRDRKTASLAPGQLRGMA